MKKRPAGGNWVNERDLERGDMRVVQGFAALRTERVFDEAPHCDDCQQERAQSSDDDALCEKHLGEALGMNSNWP